MLGGSGEDSRGGPLVRGERATQNQRLVQDPATAEMANRDD